MAKNKKNKNNQGKSVVKKRRKLSPKQSKKLRNARYRTKQKLYKEYKTKVESLIKRGAAHVNYAASYKEFSDTIGSGKTLKEIKTTAKDILEGALNQTKRAAISGRANIVKKVDYMIGQFASIIATMGSYDDVIDFLNHNASDQTSLSWKDRVKAVSLMAFVIGGYVKVRGNAEKGFYLKRISQPTLEDFRYIAGNWYPANEFIRLMLGENEEEAYGS